MSNIATTDKNATINETEYEDHGHFDHPVIHGKSVKVAHQQHHPKLQPKQTHTLITLDKHPHVKVKKDEHSHHSFKMNTEHYVLTAGSMMLVFMFLIAIIRWKTKTRSTKERNGSSDVHRQSLLRAASSPNEMRFLEDIATPSTDVTQRNVIESTMNYFPINPSRNALSTSSFETNASRNASLTSSDEFSDTTRDDDEQFVEAQMTPYCVGVETRDQINHGASCNISVCGPDTQDVDSVVAPDASEITLEETPIAVNQPSETSHATTNWTSLPTIGKYFNAFKDLWFNRIRQWGGNSEADSWNHHHSDDNTNDPIADCAEGANTNGNGSMSSDIGQSGSTRLVLAVIGDEDSLPENSSQDILAVCTGSKCVNDDVNDVPNELDDTHIITSQINNTSEIIPSSSTTVQRSIDITNQSNSSTRPSTVVNNNNNIAPSANVSRSYRRASDINTTCQTSSHSHLYHRSLSESEGVGHGCPSDTGNRSDVANLSNHRRRMRRRYRSVSSSQSHYSRIPSLEVSRLTSTFHVDRMARCPPYHTTSNSLLMTGESPRAFSRVHTEVGSGVVMEQMPDGSRLVLIPPPNLPEYSEATPPPPYQ